MNKANWEGYKDYILDNKWKKQKKQQTKKQTDCVGEQGFIYWTVKKQNILYM